MSFFGFLNSLSLSLSPSLSLSLPHLSHYLSPHLSHYLSLFRKQARTISIFKSQFSLTYFRRPFFSLSFVLFQTLFQYISLIFPLSLPRSLSLLFPTPNLTSIFIFIISSLSFSQTSSSPFFALSLTLSGVLFQTLSHYNYYSLFLSF